MFKDEKGDISIPAAAALRLINKSQDISSDSYDNIDIRYGSRALKALKSKPRSGVNFIPLTIGRTNSTYQTSKILSHAEFAQLFFGYLDTQFGPEEQYEISIPFYWSPLQLAELAATIPASRKPSYVTDRLVVVHQYNDRRFLRYRNGTRTVLFVDVGGVSAKAYVYNFSSSGDSAVASEISAVWSEQLGGIHFAQAVATARNISLKKAQRLLKSGAVNEIAPLVANLTALVASAAANVTIDEVQIIGGASGLSFVVDAIKSALNATVLRDLNSIEAIATGCLVRAANAQNTTQAPFLRVLEAPAHTAVLAYGANQSLVCQRGVGCNGAVEIRAGSAVDLRVILVPADLADGVSPLQYVYRMNNLTAKPNATIRVYFLPQQPAVRAIEVCVNDTCAPVSANQLPLQSEETFQNTDFVNGLLQHQNERAESRKQLEGVLAVFNKIQEQLREAFEAKNISGENLPPELYGKFLKFKKSLEDGTLQKKSPQQLRDAQTDLKILQKYLVDATKNAKGKGTAASKAKARSAKETKKKLADDL